ncbi:8323_t:CDS:2, partial [Acaulospora morrowiae]
ETRRTRNSKTKPLVEKITDQRSARVKRKISEAELGDTDSRQIQQTTLQLRRTKRNASKQNSINRKNYELYNKDLMLFPNALYEKPSKLWIKNMKKTTK